MLRSLYIFLMSEQSKYIETSLEKIRSLPTKERLDALLEHKDHEALIKALTPYDLMFLFHDTGAENALELVEHLSESQVRELFDFAIWNNDALDYRKTGSWLSILFAANPDKAMTQIDGLDIELLGLLFKMVTDIYDTTLNEEPPEFTELISKSPDGRFIICFKESKEYKGLAMAMHHYIETLYGLDMKRALSLIENVRFEFASGLMESSFHLRNARMLDMGILPRDERLAYFSTITLAEVKRTKKHESLPHVRAHSSFPLLAQVERLNNKHPFLYAALAKSSSEEALTYTDNLVHASINMHASLSSNFGDNKELIQTIEYIKTLADYGLAQATNGQPDEAYAILRANSIKNMIRLGRTALVNLRRIMHNALSDHSLLLGKNFERADSPLREVARALSLPEPRYYEGLTNPKKLTVRFFDALDELNATLKATHELRFRAKLIGSEVLGVSLDDLNKYPTLSHANIYARYLINSFVGNDILLSAINKKDLERVIDKNNHIKDEFLSYTKKYAKDLAYKLSNNSFYNIEESLNLTQNFNNIVLIQLEQNKDLLLS